MLPDFDYRDLTVGELTDEVSGLDREIENDRKNLARLQKDLRTKQDLLDDLLDILGSKRQNSRGWSK